MDYNRSIESVENKIKELKELQKSETALEVVYNIIEYVLQCHKDIKEEQEYCGIEKVNNELFNNYIDAHIEELNITLNELRISIAEKEVNKE